MHSNLEQKSCNIELKIPSELGYEKVAMSTVASIAGEFGFSDDKIEDIKTAVSEACINAIEHGNKMREDTNVVVIFTINDEGLTIDVIDEGEPHGFSVPHSADLSEKLKDGIKTRGLGLFLIDKLVDDVRVVDEEDNASLLRMTIHFEQKEA